jgi:serpin B
MRAFCTLVCLAVSLAVICPIRTTEAAPPDDDKDKTVPFSVSFYRAVASRQEGDVLVSPYSAVDALGMVLIGARGKTAEELAATLEFAGPRPGEFVAMLRRLRHGMSLRARSSKLELQIANRLWGQDGYPFRPQYLRALDKMFDSEPEHVDFRAPENTAQRINQWANESTAGKIVNVFAPSDITENTRLVLTNAVYFKAAWKTPFLRNSTLPGVFQSPQGDADVQYMHQNINCQYAENETLQLATLSYKGTSFSAWFLLPRQGVSIEQFESELQAERLSDWIASCRSREVELKLPKFQIEARLSLNAALRGMGVNSVFDTAHANLSGISSEPLAIDDVRQSTFIKVNEDGTEAAAVTSKGGFGGLGFQDQAVKFYLERPFLFLIRDHESGTILFMGRVTKPSYPE